MAFWWGNKRKEEEVVKEPQGQALQWKHKDLGFFNEVKLEEPKVNDEVRPNFYEVVSNYLYNRVGHNWGTIYSVSVTGGYSVRVTININPSYLFPQPLTKMGVLSIGEYQSKVNHISLSFDVEDSSHMYLSNYNQRPSDRDYDRFRSNDSGNLSITRQVFLNSDYDFVSQSNELILSEQFVRINIPNRINVSISDIRELDRRILSLIEDSKKSILVNFQQEIIKSKSEIVQKEFKKNITTQLVTDTFQHVIDLAPGSEVGEYMDAASISLFVPIEMSHYSPHAPSAKDGYMKLDLNQKSIDIFYELMEGASRIKGEYDVLTSINFIQDKIQLVISPKPIDLESIQIEGEKDRERNEYEEMRRMRMAGQMQIRNPYRDLSIWE